MSNIKPISESTNKLYISDLPTSGDVKNKYIPMGIKFILSVDQSAGAIVTNEIKQFNLSGKVAQKVIHIDVTSPTDSAKAVELFIKSVKGKPGYFPMLIHCNDGKDRTGFAAAIWLRENLSMSPDQAIATMKRYGYSTGNLTQQAKTALDLIINGGTIPALGTPQNPTTPTDVGKVDDNDIVSKSREITGSGLHSADSPSVTKNVISRGLNSDDSPSGPSINMSLAPYGGGENYFSGEYTIPIARATRVAILKKIARLADLLSDEDLDKVLEELDNEDLEKVDNKGEAQAVSMVGQRDNYGGTPDTYLNAPSGSPGAPNAAGPVDPGGLVQL